MRSGAQVLTLPVRAMKGLAEAVARFAPGAIAIAGTHGRREAAGRWSAIAGEAAGGCPLATFQRADALDGAHALSPSPLAAHHELLRLAGVSAGLAQTG